MPNDYKEYYDEIAKNINEVNLQGIEDTCKRLGELSYDERLILYKYLQKCLEPYIKAPNDTKVLKALTKGLGIACDAKFFAQARFAFMNTTIPSVETLDAPKRPNRKL